MELADQNVGLKTTTKTGFDWQKCWDCVAKIVGDGLVVAAPAALLSTEASAAAAAVVVVAAVAAVAAERDELRFDDEPVAENRADFA